LFSLLGKKGEKVGKTLAWMEIEERRKGKKKKERKRR